MIKDMEPQESFEKPENESEQAEVGSPCEKVHLGHFREDRVRNGVLLSVVNEEAEEAEEGAHISPSIGVVKEEAGESPETFKLSGTTKATKANIEESKERPTE